MSRRLGLRLVTDREVDDDVEGSGEAGQLDGERVEPQQTERRAAPDDELRDQPPALGATPAATPSR
jgi:hypothetical protein